MQAVQSFDISVTGTSPIWNVQARILPEGKPELGVFTLPFDPSALSQPYQDINQWIDAVFAKAHWPNQNDNSVARSRDFGRNLFDLLCTHGISTLYHTYRRFYRPTTIKPRLRLRLPGELALLPWELLHDAQGHALALDSSLLAVRCPSEQEHCAPLSLEPITGPLRIVGVLASPNLKGLGRLNLRKHREQLEAACRTAEQQAQVVLEFIEGPNTLELLIQRLQAPEPIHLLHIFCHGELDRGNASILHFEDANGDDLAISAQALREHLRDRHPLRQGQNDIRLVVINACQSVRQSGPQGFSSLGAALIIDGIAAALGMQFQVAEQSVNLFTARFYSEITQGIAIDLAVTRARMRLHVEYKDTIDWAIPVLYLHPDADQIPMLGAGSGRGAVVRRKGTVTVREFLLAQGFTFEKDDSDEDDGLFAVKAERVKKLSSAFVRGPLVNRFGMQDDDLLPRQILGSRHVVLFGAKGSGKSSYYLQIARRTQEQRILPDEQRRGRVLVVKFNFAESLPAIPYRDRCLDAIMIKTVEVLRNHMESPLAAHATNLREYQNIYDDLKAQYSSIANRRKPRSRAFGDSLKQLRDVAQAAGFNGIHFLADGIQDLPETSDNPAAAVAILRDILLPAIGNDWGFTFKFFLPIELEEHIRKNGELYHKMSAMDIYRIGEWKDDDLKRLLSSRLQSYSTTELNTAGGVESFRQICERDIGPIDDQIVSRARGLPIRLFRIIEAIIEHHCKAIVEPDTPITLKTIEQVLRSYSD